ncbi:hypothetical protein AALF16_20675 [Bacillus cereus]
MNRWIIDELKKIETINKDATHILECQTALPFMWFWCKNFGKIAMNL